MKVGALSYKVINAKGKEVGTVELDPKVFGAPVNETLVHSVVTWQLAKRRAGTHSTLQKGEMEGGGKKPWKQKGTGRARAGSSNSPLWVGGGVIFGPRPRSYEKRMPKKTRRQALISVLSDKVSTSNLVVLDDLKVDSGKTKDFVGILKNIGVGTGSAVLVSAKNDKVTLASRNVPKVTPLPVEGVNVYDLMKHKYLICTKDAVQALQKRVTGE